MDVKSPKKVDGFRLVKSVQNADSEMAKYCSMSDIGRALFARLIMIEISMREKYSDRRFANPSTNLERISRTVGTTRITW